MLATALIIRLSEDFLIPKPFNLLFILFKCSIKSRWQHCAGRMKSILDNFCSIWPDSNQNIAHLASKGNYFPGVKLFFYAGITYTVSFSILIAS